MKKITLCLSILCLLSCKSNDQGNVSDQEVETQDQVDVIDPNGQVSSILDPVIYRNQLKTEFNIETFSLDLDLNKLYNQ